MKARARLEADAQFGGRGPVALKARILEGECEGIGFWLSGLSDGVSRQTHRAGEEIEVEFCPDDQFAREVKP